AAAARADDRDRLAGRDRQCDVVHGLYQRGAAAVLLAQGVRSDDGGVGLRVGHRCLALFQYLAHASSQRRSAWRRSTTPSSSSAATDVSGSANAARWAWARARSSSPRCRSTIVTGSASPAAAAATSLR